MFSKQDACIYCNSEKIFKVPAILDIKTSTLSSSKPGKIVDEYIKSTKQEIKKEKDILKSKEL